MYECYAMQILETKKTKTKEQWSSKTGGERQEKDGKTKHHSRRIFLLNVMFWIVG